jgi:hypothetical protein
LTLDRALPSNIIPAMTFADLRSQYSEHDLSHSPSNHELKYRIFAPVLNNLFEDKVVYDERFLCIVRLENVEITPERFSALAVPGLSLTNDHFLNPQPPSEPWAFGAAWGYLRLLNNSLNVPYGGWSIWPEYDRVKRVEHLVKEGSLQDAWLLTCNEPEVAHGTE